MEGFVALMAEDLKHRAAAVAAGAAMPPKDDLHPEIDAVVRQLLKSCSELMASCASLASGPHELAVNVLKRSVIEMVLKLHWATLSAENARYLLAAPREHAKAIFRANAEAGKAKIVDKDGTDFTAAFLAEGRAARGHKSISIETMARQAELQDLYNVFYRFQSGYTHGIELSEGTSETTRGSLAGLGAFCILLGHVGVRWLVHRSRPGNEEIRSLLGLDSGVHT